MLAGGPGLDVRLDEHVQDALEVDDPRRVAERLVAVAVVDQTADHLIGHVRGRKQTHLTQNVRPAARKDPRLDETEPAAHGCASSYPRIGFMSSPGCSAAREPRSGSARSASPALPGRAGEGSAA